MILGIHRYKLRIYPTEPMGIEDKRDLVFIETVLGLKNDGDSIKLVRRNAKGLNCLAYLETEKVDK